MTAITLKDGYVDNFIVVSDMESARELGAVPLYSGVRLGQLYAPPTLDSLSEKLAKADAAAMELFEAQQTTDSAIMELYEGMVTV